MDRSSLVRCGGVQRRRLVNRLCDVPAPGHNGIERKGGLGRSVGSRTLGRLESVSAQAIRRACVDHQAVAGEAQLREFRRASPRLFRSLFMEN
jgi:hypothetical protein